MLAKDPGRRYQLIHEVHTDLASVSQRMADTGLLQPVPASTPEPGKRSIAPLWTVILGVCAMTVGASAVWYLEPAAAPALDAVPFHHEIPLPEGERLASFYRQSMALSPDGKQLAFVSGTSASTPLDFAKTRKIYLRRLDQWQARPIPGTENADQPFFSPDGNWLGFVTRRGELKKVNLAGGDPVKLCQSGAPYGATWGPDDTIIFARCCSGLFRVAASGGEPEQITSLDEEAAEVSHRLPHILPNGKAVLFTALPYKVAGLDWKRAHIFVQSLETSERKLLIQGGSDARYVPSGHLAFAREGRLLAVPFDPVRLEVNGPEVPVLDGINHSIYGGNSLRETGVAQFSFSQIGMLAHVAGSVFPELKRNPVWVDRQGREEPLGVAAGWYVSGRVSADGRQILLNRHYPPRDIWLFDLDRQTLRRQTFEGNHDAAIWGPGPEYFTVASDREGPANVYTKRVHSGPGKVGRLSTENPEAWGARFVVAGREAACFRNYGWGYLGAATGGKSRALPADQVRTRLARIFTGWTVDGVRLE